MNWRKKRPEFGEMRQREVFAWWPTRFEYEGENVTVWLEKYVREDRASIEHRWVVHRLLTLPDAVYERLNPKPAPDPTVSNLQPYTLQYGQTGVPSTTTSIQAYGQGVYPSQIYYPQQQQQLLGQLSQGVGSLGSTGGTGGSSTP